MPSAFGHAFSAIAMGTVLKKELRSLKFWLLGIFCAVCPDFDVIAFKFGIPYEHILGHRGFTHSIGFSILLSLLVMFLFYRSQRINTKAWLALFSYFFICCFSHALLDAMTTGGRGVALLAPFTSERFFLPWRVIEVSPLSISSFFRGSAYRILASEAIWIGIPGLLLIIVNVLFKRLKTNDN